MREPELSYLHKINKADTNTCNYKLGIGSGVTFLDALASDRCFIYTLNLLQGERLASFKVNPRHGVHHLRLLQNASLPEEN